jgi:hypothetical protein
LLLFLAALWAGCYGLGVLPWYLKLASGISTFVLCAIGLSMLDNDEKKEKGND